MKNKKSISLLWLATLLISACGSSSAELTVQDAWARPAINGNNGAAYFIIENDTSSYADLVAQTLPSVGASAPDHIGADCCARGVLAW